MDINDPTDPKYKGTYDTTGMAQQVKIYGHYAFIADSGNGIVIVDVEDPNAPFYAGMVDTEGSSLGIETYGNAAFVADADSGMKILRIIDTPSLYGNLILCPTGPASEHSCIQN